MPQSPFRAPTTIAARTARDLVIHAAGIVTANLDGARLIERRSWPASHPPLKKDRRMQHYGRPPGGHGKVNSA
ncbi:hypothetical protein [Streptomyces sp. NPDC057418]|uniref:hypothetical protein n=1 Tax=Streptomyces sp. NPDC057418 TaxID=3346126 RepID=UPI0036BA1299